jgi:hypothetical protein
MVHINWTKKEHKFIGHEIFIQNTPFEFLNDIEPSIFSMLHKRTREIGYNTLHKAWTYFTCEGFLSEWPQLKLQHIYAKTQQQLDTELDLTCLAHFNKPQCSIRTFINAINNKLTIKWVLNKINETAEQSFNIHTKLNVPDNFYFPTFVHFNCKLTNADRCMINWSESPKYTLTFPVAPICVDRPTIFYI